MKFLNNIDATQAGMTGNASTATNSDKVDNTHAYEFVTRVDLAGSVQTVSYRKSVIALCELTNTDMGLNSYSSGRITFHRFNELASTPMITVLVGMEKRYNTTSPQCTYRFWVVQLQLLIHR
jgi:hypothetical protein